MRAELLQLAADLAKRREPFVLAMVVRREPYSSAHVGDMAILTADGAYHGWLGGNCTRPTVRREAKCPSCSSVHGVAPDFAPRPRAFFAGVIC